MKVIVWDVSVTRLALRESYTNMIADAISYLYEVDFLETCFGALPRERWDYKWLGIILLTFYLFSTFFLFW